jgi:hypothetical protein
MVPRRLPETRGHPRISQSEDAHEYDPDDAERRPFEREEPDNPAHEADRANRIKQGHGNAPPPGQPKQPSPPPPKR